MGLGTVTGVDPPTRNQWCGIRARYSSCICWLL